MGRPVKKPTNNEFENEYGDFVLPTARSKVDDQDPNIFTVRSNTLESPTKRSLLGEQTQSTEPDRKLVITPMTKISLSCLPCRSENKLAPQDEISVRPKRIDES